MKRVKLFCVMQAVLLSTSVVAVAAGGWGLQPGPLTLQSVGPLTFGPEGVLIIGDPKAAAIVAIDTEDRQKASDKVQYDIENLNKRLADHFEAPSVSIVDLAVNPVSGNIYLSVVAKGSPAIARVTSSGEVSTVSMDKIAHARVELQDAPEDKETGEGRRRRNRRNESITDLAYSDGRILISGLTNSQAPSGVREFDFPFNENSSATSVEIYHAAHGKYEDYAAIRTFVPFSVGGKPSLLAGFTCTPLVKFPLDALESGSKVRGTTVAELGNRNQPLDMVVYKRDGKDYLLMANSARGVMKISTDDIERNEGLTERVSGGGVAGQPYETIEDLKGVVQLDKLDDTRAVILVQSESGAQHLKTIMLP